MECCAIEMRKITKRFPRVVANSEVDFSVYKGEIHALVGENGAGKSTLMNILYGMYMPTSGEILVNGQKVEMSSALDAIKHGIGMVHQHFMLVPRLSVAENITLGREPRRKKFFYDRNNAVECVDKICRQFGLHVDPEAPVESISLGMQQRTEIVKTLYRGADVIILDEPTAVLTPQEIDELGEVLIELKRIGKTVILITHKIEEVMNFSDRITVLRQGKKVQTLNTKDTTPREITRLMVGKDVILAGHKEPVDYKEKVLEVSNLSLLQNGKLILNDISFTLRRGEILGIAGIDGSGQTQLAEIISGVLKADHGLIRYKGREISRDTVSARKKDGIAFIPQDRHKYGLILPLSIEQNLILGFQKEEEVKGNFPFIHTIDYKKVKENAIAKVNQFDVRPADASAKVQDLSGGNQQKVIIAREIGRKTDLIIADQPTRGVDIGAIEFIHEALTSKRNKGCGILLVSLELDEVMMLSDRVAVMNEGRIVGIVNPKTVTREEIGLMMLGNVPDREMRETDEKS